MANIDIREGLLYTETHEWVKVEDDIATMGITDYAQKEMGDLVYAEPEEEGEELDKGDVMASIESVKAADEVYSPVTGEVVEANEDIEDEPEKLNEAPYDTWIIKVKLADKAELDELMDADAYKEFCED